MTLTTALKALVVPICLTMFAGCTDLKPIQSQIDDLKSQVGKAQGDASKALSDAAAANHAAASAASAAAGSFPCSSRLARCARIGAPFGFSATARRAIVMASS